MSHGRNLASLGFDMTHFYYCGEILNNWVASFIPKNSFVLKI